MLSSYKGVMRRPFRTDPEYNLTNDCGGLDGTVSVDICLVAFVANLSSVHQEKTRLITYNAEDLVPSLRD